MFLITADNLDQWADKHQAESELPQLLSWLISTTCDCVRLHMQGGKGIYLGDFDGVVECWMGNAFVPGGLSVWEVSTKFPVTNKANRDYKKRTDKPGSVDPSTTSFVFATPRTWGKWHDWESGKAAENSWKGVRALCAEHIKNWLHKAPWIEVRFARHLGRDVDGFRTIGMIWDEYATIAHRDHKELSPSLVLAGRDDVAKLVRDWATEGVRSKDRIIALAGPSVREVNDFVAASLHYLDPTDWELLEPRTFTIDSPTAARWTHGLAGYHIIIAAGEVIPHVVTLSKSAQCKVIVVRSAPTAVTGPVPVYTLPPLDPNGAIRALTTVDFSEEEAARIWDQSEGNYETIRQIAFGY